MSKKLPDKKFGKELGEKTEDNYLIGRWYLHSDGDRVYIIKKKKGDDWIVDRCKREGYYDAGEWRRDISLKEDRYYGHLILLPENVDSMSKVEKYVEHSVGNALAVIDSGEVEPVLSESTDVVPTGKDELSRMLTFQKELIKLGSEYEVMEISLNEKRSIMESKVRKVQEELKHMQNILDTVGLYLGIDEAVMQIQDGEEGEGPLCLRQRILYMDEEIAVHHFNELGFDDGGADWKDILQFDEWVKNNLDVVLPEEKGIVILKIRRFDKDYGDDPWLNHFANIPNQNTYFLIRNGEKIWRVWENIQIVDRLFPRVNEIEDTEDAFNRKQEKIQRYNKHMLAIQGILDRTGIFGGDKFDLMSPDDKDLRLIRDDEDVLPAGRMSWTDFRNDVNGKIVVGTRFVLAATWRTWSSDIYGSQLSWLCKPPTNGIYNCTKITKGSYSEKVWAMYMPDGEVYSWTEGVSERKNRKSFYLYRGDYILNYDDVTIEDLEFYINDRTARKDYLKLVPVLMEMLTGKREERVWEDNFKEFMKGEYFDGVDGIDDMLDKAIEWWKFKVIMKRPLKKEDAKAVRMIKGRVKRMIKGEVE